MPGDAVAALHGAVVDKRVLQGVQPAASAAQTLDGGHRGVVRLRRRHQARHHGLTIQPHRTGAALALGAALLCAGQAGIVAQGVEQRFARRAWQLARLAVDRASPRSRSNGAPTDPAGAGEQSPAARGGPASQRPRRRWPGGAARRKPVRRPWPDGRRQDHARRRSARRPGRPAARLRRPPRRSRSCPADTPRRAPRAPPTGATQPRAMRASATRSPSKASTMATLITEMACARRRPSLRKTPR